MDNFKNGENQAGFFYFPKLVCQRAFKKDGDRNLEDEEKNLTCLYFFDKFIFIYTETWQVHKNPLLYDQTLSINLGLLYDQTQREGSTYRITTARKFVQFFFSNIPKLFFCIEGTKIHDCSKILFTCRIKIISILSFVNFFSFISKIVNL